MAICKNQRPDRSVCQSTLYRCTNCGWVGCNSKNKCQNTVQRPDGRCVKCGKLGQPGGLFKPL